MGALSFSPSPMTTVPFMPTVEIRVRIALTATPSAPFLSPRPTQRPAAIAAASVTRTSSRARLRSGDEGATASPSGRGESDMRPMLSGGSRERGTRRVHGHLGGLHGQLDRRTGSQPELGDGTRSDLGREVAAGDLGADPDPVAQWLEAGHDGGEG